MISAVFIGSVDFSHAALSHLLNISDVKFVGVITRASSTFNSDFKSLEQLANQHSIACQLNENNCQVTMAKFIRELKPDVVFCLGWSFILKPEVLEIPRFGVIGYHPTKLPKNRGRHPIIWTLALGLEETASTFFEMDRYADTGNIISQIILPVNAEDDARSLYDKLIKTALTQLTEITSKLNHGPLLSTPQASSNANSWRKRSKLDGQIDWRMPARSIFNLIRALSRPYPGAHCIVDGSEIKIWKSKVVPDGDCEIEPGKVLCSENGHITVKCGIDAIVILRHEFSSLPDQGDYI